MTTMTTMRMRMVGGSGGKFVTVHSSKFEEMLQSVQLLHTFCSELEGAYFDFVPATAEALLPLLSTTDQMTLLCDEARSAAFQTWALLIKVARVGATEKGTPSELPQALLKTFASMANDEDPETLGDAARGITECLKNVGE